MNFREEERLQSIHVLCWQRRSDLAALGMLFESGLPEELLQRLQPRRRDDGTSSGIFTEDLASVVVDNLKRQLEVCLAGNGDLGAWRRSFESVHAVVQPADGSLHMSLEIGADVCLLSFMCDLIPVAAGGPQGVELLQDILRHVRAASEELDDISMRRRCLRVLATYVVRAAGVTSPYQKVFERLLGSLALRPKDSDEDFLDIVNLMLESESISAGSVRSISSRRSSSRMPRGSSTLCATCRTACTGIFRL